MREETGTGLKRTVPGGAKGARTAPLQSARPEKSVRKKKMGQLVKKLRTRVWEQEPLAGKNPMPKGEPWPKS